MDGHKPPEHTEPPIEITKHSVFETASPKLTFWFGFFVGIGLMTVVAFTLLVVLVVRGVELPKKTTTTKTNTNTNQNVNEEPAPALAKVSASDVTITDRDYVRGAEDAKVTLVEFSDIECPFCKRLHPSLVDVVNANPDDVRWIYKHFPLSFHPEAKPAAVATECVGKLAGNDAFWEYLDALFEKQNELGEELYVSAAAELGVSEGEFKTCLESGEFDQKIKDDQNLGQKLGVSGTPTTYVVIGDSAEVLRGAVPKEDLEAAITAE